MLTSLRSTIPAGMVYEILLMDDFSTDGTREWLATLSDPQIKTLLNPHNLSYAKTNNKAASVATGEVLALLNNDLLFEPGWLEPMLHTLHSPTLNAGLVGNVQCRMADGKLDHAGVRLNANAQFGHIQTLADDAPPHTKVLAVTGACMLLRRADFEAVGGFDEDFVNGCEDIDLAFKLRAMRKHIYVATASRIRHHVSLSRKLHTLQDVRNSQRLFHRWHKEIKQELGAVWHQLLLAGPAAYADILGGQLADAFLKTPHTAARVIAEAMLQREASSWAKSLGGTNPKTDLNTDLASRVTTRGLRYSSQYHAHLLENSAEFVVAGLRYACNFYVCGRRIDDLSRSIMLTISVNGLQTLNIPLEAGRNVNVGIIEPLLLPNTVNYFRVETNGVIVLTHIVLDDRAVDL